MKRLITLFVMMCLLIPRITGAQTQSFDSTTIAKIIDEGMNRSHAMETLNYLTNVLGPRLTGSAEYKRDTEWAMREMDSVGLQDVHLEGWGPFGKGWELESYGAQVTEPQVFPLHSYPKAWSPSIEGNPTGEVVSLQAKTAEELNKFKGKLKDKFVLIDEPRKLSPRFQPLATRLQDSTLLKLANAAVFARTPKKRARKIPCPFSHKKFIPAYTNSGARTSVMVANSFIST